MCLYFVTLLPPRNAAEARGPCQRATMLYSCSALVIKVIELMYSFSITAPGLCLQQSFSQVFNVPCSIAVLIRGYGCNHYCWAFMHPVFFFQRLDICISLSSTSQNWFKSHLSLCVLGLELLQLQHSPNLYSTPGSSQGSYQNLWILLKNKRKRLSFAFACFLLCRIPL